MWVSGKGRPARSGERDSRRAKKGITRGESEASSFRVSKNGLFVTAMVSVVGADGSGGGGGGGDGSGG